MNEKEFQRLVKERPDLARYFHYVRPGGHIKEGYYKRIPRTYRDRRARPPSQLRAQLAFGEAAYNAYGKRGFSEDDTPIVADAVRKAMRAKRYQRPKWQTAIEKLTKAMNEIAEVVEEAKKKKKVAA